MLDSVPAAVTAAWWAAQSPSPSPGSDTPLGRTVAELLGTAPVQILIIILVGAGVQVVLYRMIGVVVRKAISRSKAKQSARTGYGDDTSQLKHVLMRQRTETRARAVGQLLRSASAFLIWGIVVITSLQALGIDVTPLLLSASVVGVALGFGAQTLIKDFLSGLFIVIEDQFGVGDWVDLGPTKGRVEQVGLRVTQVRDAQGTVWYMRNGEILRVANRSQGWQHADAEVAVAESTDLVTLHHAIDMVAQRVEEDPVLSGKLLARPRYGGVVERRPGQVVVQVVARATPSNQHLVQTTLCTVLQQELTRAGVPGVSVQPAREAAVEVPQEEAERRPADPVRGLRPKV